MRHCPKCGSDYADQVAFCPTDGTPTTSVVTGPERDSFLGVVIDGRYRIEEQIGEGGMGVVYRAAHLVLQKNFAIKVMRGEQAHDADVVQRFLQEARASSAIGHPNIVNISDFGSMQDGSVYFAMEFLQGETLAHAMDAGPLDRERALGIFVQIAGALEAAHEAGIIHRDLKPENIFLKREPENPDFVKVLDFGIAKVKNAAAKLTRTGMVFGTPHYMSPEQAAGQPVDHRSDIYSLGVIMYQVFTGELPFDGDSFMDVMTKHMYETPRFPTRSANSLPAGLEKILMQALKKKPEERQQTMRELRDALEAVQAGRESEPSVHPPASVPSVRAPASEPTIEGSIGTTGTLLAAAQASDVVSEDDVVAVPKQRRPVWVWVLIGAVLVGIGALSFMGRSQPVEPVDAAGGAEAPPPSAAGSVEPAAQNPDTPPPVVPERPPNGAREPSEPSPQSPPPSAAAPTVEPAPPKAHPSQPASPPKPPKAPATPQKKPNRGGGIDPWR